MSGLQLGANAPAAQEVPAPARTPRRPRLFFDVVGRPRGLEAVHLQMILLASRAWDWMAPSFWAAVELDPRVVDVVPVYHAKFGLSGPTL